MSSPRLVFLYGPPAVGKLTVARAIAERQPFKVLHNHVTLDAVTEVLPFGSQSFWRVVNRLRCDLVAAAAKEGIDLIYTYVFAAGEGEHVSQISLPYKEIGGVVSYVQLLAPREVLLQRVLEEDRKRHGKLVGVEALEQLLDKYDTFAAIPGCKGLTVDLGATSAAEAADQILNYLPTRRSLT